MGTPSNRTDWKTRRIFALRRSEELFESVGGTVPTNLLEVARICGVRKVEFRPLHVDGATSLRKDGFCIYANAPLERVDEFNIALSADGTGRLLPTKFRNRARFTIAHEVVHTFFFDRSKTPPESTIDFEHPASYRALERTCNIGASALLLPEAALTRLFAWDWLDPDRLAEIASAAFVSHEATVFRFQNIRHALSPFGVILAVDWVDSDYVITAAATHYHFEGAFPCALFGRPLKDTIKHPDFALNGGSIPRVARGDYVYSTETFASRRTTRKAFVTIRRRSDVAF